MKKEKRKLYNSNFNLQGKKIDRLTVKKFLYSEKNNRYWECEWVYLEYKESKRNNINGIICER